jgi:hypothetical protein
MSQYGVCTVCCAEHTYTHTHTHTHTHIILKLAATEFDVPNASISAAPARFYH